jgi:hypothetical protein
MLGTRHVLLSQISFLSPDLLHYIVKNMCVYPSIHTYISDCVWSTVRTKQCASGTFLHKLRGMVRSVDWIFIIEVPAWWRLGEYVTLDKTDDSWVVSFGATKTTITPWRWGRSFRNVGKCSHFDAVLSPGIFNWILLPRKLKTKVKTYDPSLLFVPVWARLLCFPLKWCQADWPNINWLLDGFGNGGSRLW